MEPKVRGRLRDEYGEAAFKSWLNPLTVAEVRDGQVRMCVPTRFLRDWVVTHYGDRIRALWSTEDASINGVDIVVLPGVAKAAPKSAGPAKVAAAPIIAQAPCEPANVNDEIGAPLDPRYTFDNFVVGKPNEFAYAAARRVAESDLVSFNPLFLYGGVGLGKTHLMHAVAWHIRERNPKRSVIYLSAEKFMYRFVRALRFQDTMAFKEQFRSVDVLMIDDGPIHRRQGLDPGGIFSHLQFPGRPGPADHHFRRQVAVGSAGHGRAPALAPGLRPWVADIHATTYELRLGIIDSKSEQMDVAVPRKVAEFLAHKITSNVPRTGGGAEPGGRPWPSWSAATSPSSPPRKCCMTCCAPTTGGSPSRRSRKRVAEHFNIRLADMHSARRARQVARPRQVAMYLAKQLTSRSLPEIGRKFGGRDHTTVMHAVKKIEELRSADSSFAEDIELLRRMLES